jgi:hypothetical protein
MSEASVGNNSVMNGTGDDYELDRLAPGVDLRELQSPQRLALWTLLKTGSVRAAAKAAGVELSIIVLWKREDRRFLAAMRAARERLIAEDARRLAARIAGSGTEVASEDLRFPDRVYRLLRII